MNLAAIFPVITLYQPWANWIMDREKLIETRTHQRFKCLKGQTILIHAGQHLDKDAWRAGEIVATADQLVNISNRYTQIQKLGSAFKGPYGVILGSAYVYDFLPLTKEHEIRAMIECTSIQRYGLFLDRIEPFKEPIKATGSMGIWYYDLANQQKVKKNETQRKMDL